ncbi:MAG: hypothetical protein ACE5JB_02245 [bacterium]
MTGADFFDELRGDLRLVLSAVLFFGYRTNPDFSQLYTFLLTSDRNCDKLLIIRKASLQSIISSCDVPFKYLTGDLPVKQIKGGLQVYNWLE